MPISRCQHIKTNGVQCGSPALKGRRHCFFHNRFRNTEIDFLTGKGLHYVNTFTLPVLEDANSIQIALMQIIRMVLGRQIDPKISGQLLYALQTASANLRNLNFSPEPEMVVIEPRKVGEVGLGEKAWSKRDQVKALTEEEKKVRLAKELDDAGGDAWQELMAHARAGALGPEMEELCQIPADGKECVVTDRRRMEN